MVGMVPLTIKKTEGKKKMNIRRIAIAIVLVTILSVFVAAQGTNQAPVTDAPYGYVEMTGPTTYHIVGHDSLWGLTPNEWRQLQANNSKLSAAWRVSTLPNGLYRVHLTVNEPIEIPADMTIRVRLERPANFVDNPVTGGAPFVNGGINTNDPDAVRRQVHEQALRDFNRNNPGSTLRPNDFTIVGNIEHGRLHGPGIVYFADRPNEGRPTIYNGEPGYRATVRNRRTGQESQQMFLAACANDARQGNFLRAGGEGFIFVLDGSSIPSNDPTNPDDQSSGTNLRWLIYLLGIGVVLVVTGVLCLPWILRRYSWNLPFLGRFNPAPVAAAVIPKEEPVAPAEAIEEPATPPPAPAIGLVPAKTEPEMTTLVIEGHTYRVPTAATTRVNNGRVTIEIGGHTIEVAPEKRTRPKKIREPRTKVAGSK